MDGFAGKNWSELLEISQKVFDNTDSKENTLKKINRALWQHHTLLALSALNKSPARKTKRTNVLTARNWDPGKMSDPSGNR